MRAKGEVDPLVRTQAGQLNKTRAMNDAYRARHGKIHIGRTAITSTSTAWSANVSSSAPKVNHDRPSTNEVVEGTSQSSTHVDSISGQLIATWEAEIVSRFFL